MTIPDLASSEDSLSQFISKYSIWTKYDTIKWTVIIKTRYNDLRWLPTNQVQITMIRTAYQREAKPCIVPHVNCLVSCNQPAIFWSSFYFAVAGVFATHTVWNLASVPILFRSGLRPLTSHNTKPFWCICNAFWVLLTNIENRFLRELCKQ